MFVVTDENNTVLSVPFSGMVFVCDMLLSGVEMKADAPTMALAQATRCKPRKSMFESLVCIKVICVLCTAITTYEVKKAQ